MRSPRRQGRAQVKNSAKTQVQALIHASDGAPDGFGNSDALVRPNAGVNDEFTLLFRSSPR